MRRLLCTFVAGASALPLALGGSGAAALGASGSGAAALSMSRPFIPASPHQRLPLSRASVMSTNWSGYVVTSSKHHITGETTTFVVPAASKPPSGYAATWGGVGGYGTGSLVQAGISEQTSQPKYFAWYELLPAFEKRISRCSGLSSCPVSAGDVITVSINEATSTTWTIAIDNQGKWTWQKTKSYSSSHSYAARVSAEWILEAPTINGQQSTLPSLSTTLFGPTSTFTKGGTTYMLAQGNPVKLLMVKKSGSREATPSGISSADGQSFNDCAYTKSCPTP